MATAVCPRRWRGDGTAPNAKYQPIQHSRVRGAGVSRNDQRTTERDALVRLVASISRFLDPQQAIAAAHTGGIDLLDSRRFGGAWVLDQLWVRLGIGAALRGRRRPACRRRHD